MDVKIVLLMGAIAVTGVSGAWVMPREYTRTELGDSVDKASMKILKESYQAAADKNVVASPLGVLLLLSMYSSGTVGRSLREIDALLGGTQDAQSYSSMSKVFSDMDPSYLTLAYKVYVGKQFTVDDKLQNTARLYNSDIETLDFQDKKAAAATINKWADEKTKGHIKDPISDGTIDPEAAAALFNVIFFQGHWDVPFEVSETKDKDFYLDEKTTVKKPTMHLEQTLFYAENNDIGFKMVELPYKETDFRMVVVLPNEKNGLPALLEKVATRGLLEDVFHLRPAGRVFNLEIPKFEVKSKLDLTSILPKVGVSSIFSDPAPGIVKNASVKVSKVFQEAFVKVDEEGATAGAFTGVVAVPMSSHYRMPEPTPFKVDHPFLYLILYQDKILFTGTYTH